MIPLPTYVDLALHYYSPVSVSQITNIVPALEHRLGHQLVLDRFRLKASFDLNCTIAHKPEIVVVEATMLNRE